LSSISTNACNTCLVILIGVIVSAELRATLRCSYHFGVYHFFNSEPTPSIPTDRSRGEFYMIQNLIFCNTLLFPSS
jgi:hypothetical protein